jgi:hypothetical protein
VANFISDWESIIITGGFFLRSDKKRRNKTLSVKVQDSISQTWTHRTSFQITAFVIMVRSLREKPRKEVGNFEVLVHLLRCLNARQLLYLLICRFVREFVKLQKIQFSCGDFATMSLMTQIALFVFLQNRLLNITTFGPSELLYMKS